MCLKQITQKSQLYWLFIYKKDETNKFCNKIKLMKNVKLIACDIDGTITKSDRSTSQRNINTISKIRNKNIIFGLASGRPVEDIIDKYKEWGLDSQFDFIIGWNGGQLYDNKTGNTYEYNYLDKREIKEIISFMQQFDCTINMYIPHIYLSSKETDRSWFSAFKSKRKYIVVDSLSKFYEKDNCGIMFRCDENDMPLIESKVNEFIKGKKYIGFKTQPDLMEFSSRACNKGYALKKYTEMYNISLDDCMAFGDTTNDNEMLKICYGICMKNGSEDTKRCAKIITDIECDNDGFSEFVEKNIL